jgi:hypothetical protein
MRRNLCEAGGRLGGMGSPAAADELTGFTKGIYQHGMFT